MSSPFAEPTQEEYHRMLARSMPEHDLVTKIIRLAAERGWLAIHQRPAQVGTLPRNPYGKVQYRTAIQGHRGFPDLVLVAPWLGGVLFRECKTQTGTLEPEQRKWRDHLLGAGADWALWRPMDWMDGTIDRALRGVEAN